MQHQIQFTVHLLFFSVSSLSGTPNRQLKRDPTTALHLIAFQHMPLAYETKPVCLQREVLRISSNECFAWWKYNGNQPAWITQQVSLCRKNTQCSDSLCDARFAGKLSLPLHLTSRLKHTSIRCTSTLGLERRNTARCCTTKLASGRESGLCDTGQMKPRDHIFVWIKEQLKQVYCHSTFLEVPIRTP